MHRATEEERQIGRRVRSRKVAQQRGKRGRQSKEKNEEFKPREEGCEEMIAMARKRREENTERCLRERNTVVWRFILLLFVG